MGFFCLNVALFASVPFKFRYLNGIMDGVCSNIFPLNGITTSLQILHWSLWWMDWTDETSVYSHSNGSVQLHCTAHVQTESGKCKTKQDSLPLPSVWKSSEKKNKCSVQRCAAVTASKDPPSRHFSGMYGFNFTYRGMLCWWLFV